MLDDIKQGLEESIYSISPVTIQLELGGFCDLGYQYRFLIRTKDLKNSFTLFRAYVMLDGKNVSFDFYDEESVTLEAKSDIVFKVVADYVNRIEVISEIQNIIAQNNKNV